MDFRTGKSFDCAVNGGQGQCPRPRRDGREKTVRHIATQWPQISLHGGHIHIFSSVSCGEQEVKRHI